MPRLFCACCGRPFERSSTRGPSPLYCSADCRRQMAVRRRAWTRADLIGPLTLAQPGGRDAERAPGHGRYAA
ncbi:hypothetical protein [Azospirillum sp.]|uniref:hypothetical protein n=1 Tax=Azospirillum sp. TaxID=34012 RepID=UPI003D7175CA